MGWEPAATAGRSRSESPLTPASERAIDVQCDRFEAAWQMGPPKIEDHLAAWPGHERAAERRQLLQELVHIDLESRWRASAGTPEADNGGAAGWVPGGSSHVNGLPVRPQLEDYLNRYPELQVMEQARLELVIAEYRIRQVWGDRPRYEDYCNRFSFPGLDRRLRNVAAALTPTVVTIYRQQQRIFSTKLNLPLEIGRQREGEPPPYCRMNVNGVDRIVVAALHNNMVSRNHVYLDIVAKNEFRVENRSGRSILSLGAAGRLPPGGIRFLSRPIRLVVGQTTIGLEES